MIPINMNGSDQTLIRSNRARIDLRVVPPADGATVRSICPPVELELIGKPSLFLFSSLFRTQGV
jgi:hypothetical protein